MTFLRNRKGQATIEAGVLLAVVIMAIVLMRNYVHRAAAGGLKSNADSLGSQFSTVDGFGSVSLSHSTDAASDSTSCYEQQIGTGGAGVAPGCTGPAGFVAPQ